MKISGSFKTQDNNTIRVVFYNKKNTASSININTSDDIYFGEEPVIITTEVDDTFAHLLKTQAKITLVTRRWLGDYLFADNVKSIVVNIWKNDVCIFAGYVSANTYNQQYSHELEELEINCIDTLSTLKNRRLTDDTTYEDLVAQSTIRPFSWFFDKIDLEDPAGVIPNLPDYPMEEMYASDWIETGWGRNVSDTPVTYQDGQNTVTSYITYYGIESECVILDSETAVATGETRIGEDKTPTYIQSTDTCIVDGIQYYKKYAWITVKGEQTNTGDWIVGDPTDDMPYVVRQETRLTGWSTGVLPQPFDFWEHMTTFDVYSNGMEVAVSDSIGEQIPETPQTTTNGSYYEFRQGADDDLDVDEETGYEYYKNYAWVCVNNVCENSGQWVRGNRRVYVVDTVVTLVKWDYGTPAVPFEYYEYYTVTTTYSDGTSTTTNGSTQIPLSPNVTSNGSYYDMRPDGLENLDVDTITGKQYFKNYAWVTFDGTTEKTNDWVRGQEIEDTNGFKIWGTVPSDDPTDTNDDVVYHLYNYSPRIWIKAAGSNDFVEYDADYYDPTTRQFGFTNIPTTITDFNFDSDYQIQVITEENGETVTNNINFGSAKKWYRELYFKNIDTSSKSNWGKTFDSLNKCDTIDISRISTAGATKMGITTEWQPRGMFGNCGVLTNVNLSNIDTSNVDDISYMFVHCNSLSSIDLSNFDTSNVESFVGMFEDSGVTTLNLSTFDTTSAISMSKMFSSCDSLTSLDLRNFDVSNVEIMNSMFSGCTGLTSVNTTGWDTGNVQDMSWMFAFNKSSQSIDISHFDTSNVTTMQNMFSGTFEDLGGATRTINVSGLTNTKLESMRAMFSGCYATSIDFTGFTTPMLKSMYETFNGCNYITSLNLSSFNTSNVTSMYRTFRSCIRLTSLNLSSFNTSNVTSMESMFQNCSSITSLNLSSFNTSNVTNMRYMFSGCTGLTSLDLSNFNTSNVTNMERMFSGCAGLTSLNLSNWNIDNTPIPYMLYGTDSLTSITMNNVSDTTFNKIGTHPYIHNSRVTIYRDGDAYKWNSSTQQWEIQNNN